NSKPPLITSEMTAIAVPRTVHPGSCVHLSPIGQPTSHSPAAIKYAQAIATSCARSRCDSRDHSEGRFQIRDSGSASVGADAHGAPALPDSSQHVLVERFPVNNRPETGRRMRWSISTIPGWVEL